MDICTRRRRQIPTDPSVSLYAQVRYNPVSGEVSALMTESDKAAQSHDEYKEHESVLRKCELKLEYHRCQLESELSKCILEIEDCRSKRIFQMCEYQRMLISTTRNGRIQ